MWHGREFVKSGKPYQHETTMALLKRHTKTMTWPHPHTITWIFSRTAGPSLWSICWYKQIARWDNIKQPRTGSELPRTPRSVGRRHYGVDTGQLAIRHQPRQQHHWGQRSGHALLLQAGQCTCSVQTCCGREVYAVYMVDVLVNDEGMLEKLVIIHVLFEKA